MKNLILRGLFLLFLTTISAQKVVFEEYDLKNGMHVILHQNHESPFVITSVMYHVGSKNENPNRTGFAHFFEHLLFEGTKNIKRKEWFKIVSSNGGKNNAYTTQDYTYYYEVFPANNLKLGLWMESERLLHPIITQEGVDTQNEVVKEEKRMRFDNQPYGKIFESLAKNIFKKHPYRWVPIGKMAHLDAATLKEFKDFNKKFYVPNNAVLVVAGDFKKQDAKKWIKEYFETIPKGKKIIRKKYKESPITKAIKSVVYDEKIQIPALLKAYRIPAFTERDNAVLFMIGSYLSDGKSSVLYKKIVDEKQMALQIQTIPIQNEEYGMYVILAIASLDKKLKNIDNVINQEIKKLQTDLISERVFEKLQNTFEKKFIDTNESLEGIATTLALCFTYFKNTEQINKTLKIYRSITREEIRAVAKKYLNPNQSLYLEYLPKKKKLNPKKEK